MKNKINVLELEKKVKLSDASQAEIVNAIQQCHPEACDEEIEYKIWFNRLSEEEKKVEFALQNPY